MTRLRFDSMQLRSANICCGNCLPLLIDVSSVVTACARGLAVDYLLASKPADFPVDASTVQTLNFSAAKHSVPWNQHASTDRTTNSRRRRFLFGRLPADA